MSFYNDLMEQDRIYEGLDAPHSPSVLRLMNDLSRLQSMTPEERAEKNRKLDELFASFEEEWKRKGLAK